MNKPITNFIEKYFLHFNAAALVDAAKGYEKQLEQGSKMLVSLAGAMSTAELGISFAEMLHIGDHQINDIFAADQLGIKTLWFNNKNTKWVQAFEKPKDFSDWKKLPERIEELYE